MRVKELNDLKKLRNDSEDYRKFIYSDEDWDRFGAYWYNKQDVADNILPIPALTSKGYTTLGNLLQDIHVDIQAVHNPELIPAARIATQQINQLNEDTHLMDEILLACQDAIGYGTGTLLDGFGSQFGVDYDTQFTGIERTRHDKDQERRLEYHDYVYEDKPFTIRVHPRYVLFPPGTTDLPNAYGFFLGYVRHIDEVKADERYMAKHRNAVKPNAHYSYRINPENKKDIDHVLLWDWYDLRTNKRTTFCQDYSYALADETDELLIRFDRLPLHLINFNPHPDYIWGGSDFAFLEPLAQDLNDAITMRMIYGHLSVMKGIVNVDMLEGDSIEEKRTALQKMTSDEVLALIECHGDPREVVAFATPSQPYDLQPRIEHLKKEIEEFGSIAIGKTQKGMMSGGRHTKYEVQKTEANFQQSIYPRRRVLENVIRNVVYNRLQLIYDFWQEPKVCRTYNAAGQPVLVEFKGADLRGDYRIDVRLQQVRQRTPGENIEEATHVMQTSMPFAQMGVVDPDALYRQYILNLDSPRWDVDTLTIKPQQPLGQPIPFELFGKQFQQAIPYNRPAMNAALGMENQPPIINFQQATGQKPPGQGQQRKMPGIPSPPKPQANPGGGA